MSAYNVTQTVDVMDVFDEMSAQDQKDFIHDAFKGLSYNDQEEVAEENATYLDPKQMKQVAEAMFGYMEPADCYDMVRTLADMLANSQIKELINYLEND